jgi:hypothetical protein
MFMYVNHHMNAMKYAARGWLNSCHYGIRRQAIAAKKRSKKKERKGVYTSILAIATRNQVQAREFGGECWTAVRGLKR